MAGGPIFYYSAFPVTSGRVFPSFFVGDGANSKEDEGLGVEASVGANSIWRLRFAMPPTLPTGTGKPRAWGQADAVTGVARVHVKWASVAMAEDPSSATLNDETVASVTWTTAEDDVYKEIVTTLDADTLVADEIVVMDWTFETASWTLAVESVWNANTIMSAIKRTC